MKDMREAITGELILQCRAKNRLSLVVVDSKLSSKVADFERVCPDSFFDIGIMEQNAINVAAGLSSDGDTVVMIGIATFVSMRGFEQIRSSLAYGNYRVKIVGLWSGLYYTIQGHTHVSVNDIAIMTAIPNMTVYNPSDSIQAARISEDICHREGPAYVRVESPFIKTDLYPTDYEFRFGFPDILLDGRDIALVTTGRSAYVCKAAAVEMKRLGIHAKVINLPTLKPINEEALLNAVSRTRAVITVEEHSLAGGLGSIVAAVLLRNGFQKPLEMIGVEDTFTENVSYDRALCLYGLTVENIIGRSKALIAKCK